MSASRWCVLLVTAIFGQATSDMPVFRPFEERGYVHVNAHQFSADGETLYLAMFPERVAAEKGLPAPEASPEVSIYVAHRTAEGGWSAPEPISFAGPHKDYEPTLSPDGTVMLFNSWRPMPDGTPVDNGKNNLWLSRFQSGDWTEPVLLEGVSKLDTEESYPTITASGRVYYCQETENDDYDIYTGRLVGHRLVDIESFAPAATPAGEGDPWVSPDGRMLVFTRWETGGDWSATVDLYVTFRRDGRWTVPVRLSLNDPEGPDFSPSASGDGETFYWKQRDGTKLMPMAELIES